MRPASAVELVIVLSSCGLNHSEISRRTGIPRETVRDWIRNGRDPAMVGLRNLHLPNESCPHIGELDPANYAYLLGLYLGDGCLSEHRGEVFNLRIVCCNAYPQLMEWCEEAMKRALPNKVCRVRKIGCTELASYSKHWPCLFPQHGPGRKHERSIILADWQQTIVDLEPKQLLRGLIHSDGCRSDNWVGGKPYTRYTFTNASGDIRNIFCGACDRLGVDWRQMNARNISVARRRSVEFLDTFIGPKT